MLILIPSSSFGDIGFLQNFESGSLGLSCNAIEGTNAVCTISSTVAHSGTYSLKTDVTTAGGNAFITIGGVDGGFSDSIYVRFYVYISSAMVASMTGGEYYDFFHCTDTGYGIVWIAGLSGDAKFRIDADDFGGEDVGTVVADTWYCLEFYCDQDASAGVITMWIDGIQVKTETSLNTGADGFHFRIGGGGWWSDGITGEMYIDDFIVDTKYIGTGYRIQDTGRCGSR